MNPTVEVAGDGIARQGGYTFMGSLGTVSVDTQQAIWTIVVPAPQEEVLGTAPASISYEVNSSHQLVIVLRRNLVLDLMPGEQVTIEVGVKLPKEGIGVYGITLIGE